MIRLMLLSLIFVNIYAFEQNIDIKIVKQNSFRVNSSFPKEYMDFVFRKNNNEYKLFIVEQSKSCNNASYREDRRLRKDKNFRDLATYGANGYLYNGKSILPADYVVQPIANEKVYILTWHKGDFPSNPYSSSKVFVSFYNEKTNKYIYVGELIKLEDLDNDNIPEIIVFDTADRDNYYVVSYKIALSNNKYVLKTFSKNKVKKEIYERAYGSKMLYIKYFKDKNFIIVKAGEFFTKKYNFKGYSYNEYIRLYNLSKWNKTKNFIYDTTSDYSHPDNSQASKDLSYKAYSSTNSYKKLLKHNLVPKLDEVEQYEFEAQLKGKVRCIKKLYYLSSKLDEVRVPLKNLTLCEHGKSGVINFKNNRFMITDFDFDDLRMKKFDDKYTVMFNEKYLIVYDTNLEIPYYFLWNKVLGYKPKKVVYVAHHKLIVFKNNNLIEYKINIEKSKVKKIKW